MKRRLYVLDAMRGLAAVAVIDLHGSTLFGWPLIPRAHIAVDFFFLLSGFIMQYTYGERLANGWPASAFLRARFIRLYPIYFLAMMVGAAPLLRLSFRLPFLHAPRSLWHLLLPALALVPVRYAWAAFPLNVAAWSLLCEGAANVLHAFVLRRLRPLALASILVLGGVVFVWDTLRLGTSNIGSRTDELAVGLARAVFSYILGMLLHRWWGRHPRFADVPPVVPMAALILVLVTPMWGHPLFTLVDVLILFPVILLTGAMSDGGQRTEAISEWLGSISYPLYLLHVPMLWIASLIFLPHGILPNTHAMTALSVLTILILLAVSWLTAAFYDPPARAALNRLLPGRKHLPHAPRP